MESRRGGSPLPSLVGFVLLAFVPAAVGGLFQPGAWYLELAKPSWTPPGWLFAPVWTVLYLSIGVAGWLVWRRAGLAEAPVAWSLYGLQLLLNGAWSWIFFGLEAPGAALVEIAALWLAIAATIVAFRRLSPAAAGLLVPYFAWVSFAAALNAAIWRLNG